MHVMPFDRHPTIHNSTQRAKRSPPA